MVQLSTSLVEREGDRSRLEQAVAELGVSGSLVLVSGEAGFGKTSLLKEFVASLPLGEGCASTTLTEGRSKPADQAALEFSSSAASASVGI